MLFRIFIDVHYLYVSRHKEVNVSILSFLYFNLNVVRIFRFLVFREDLLCLVYSFLTVVFFSTSFHRELLLSLLELLQVKGLGSFFGGFSLLILFYRYLLSHDFPVFHSRDHRRRVSTTGCLYRGPIVSVRIKRLLTP